MEYNLAGAFVVGLMGAGHCVGMCGGLVGAFANQIPSPRFGRNLLSHRLGFLTAYNGGRLFSYTLAGAIAGGATGGLAALFNVGELTLWLRLLAGVMMITLGLYIAKLWSGLSAIERLGKGLWSLLQPIAKQLLPLDSRRKALLAGACWGWLPCGLVYSTLTWAVASADMVQGALIMLSFGLGTLPVLLGAGAAAKALSNYLQRQKIRFLSGVLLIGFGLQTLYIGVAQLS